MATVIAAVIARHLNMRILPMGEGGLVNCMLKQLISPKVPAFPPYKLHHTHESNLQLKRYHAVSLALK